jgi:hypothetical protein
MPASSLTIRLTKSLIVISFFLVTFILAACINTPAAPLTQVATATSPDAFVNVMISKPTDKEMETLPTISRLTPTLCTGSDSTKVCTFSSDQAIKWGWGFCENDAEKLHQSVSFAKVDLIIDELAIPDSLIYQRNETYKREQQPYCHVWIVKLSNWRPSTTITLTNRNSILDHSAQQNTFTIEVK